jgi:SNF2 family DNA or RNA helicase
MKLHEYQKKAIKFGLENKAVYYAIDLGLGKTAIDLHRIKIMKNHGIKSIVFAPIPVIYNTWPMEIKNWGLDLSFEILHGPEKSYILQKKNPDIFLINYEGLKWFREAISTYVPKWKPRSLVLDEGSFIKDPSTLRFKSLKKMMPLWHERRSVLSATPAPNGYHNLWTQYYMLDRGLRLGKTYNEFRGRFFHYSGPPLFKTTIRPGMDVGIQRLIKDITFRLENTDRPYEMVFNNIPLELPPKMRELYNRLEKDFLLEFEGSDATAFSAAALSMKLRQFIQGAIYTNTETKSYEILHQVKAEALKALVEALNGNPLLCAIQFRFELEMINKIFGKEVPYIAKGISPKRVMQLVDEWNSGSIPLLLCHPASIGHGVNMQKSGYNLLWYAQTWSLEHYQQLIGRIARQGQMSKTVVINTLMLKNTIDERITKTIQKKGITQKDLLDALKM